MFDHNANGRAHKANIIVNDAAHEAEAIELERAISGYGMTRMLDRSALPRALPQLIQADNGKKFSGDIMVA